MSKATWAILFWLGSAGLSAHALEAVETIVPGEISPLFGEPRQALGAPWISLNARDAVPGTAFISTISATGARSEASEASLLLSRARLNAEHAGGSTGSLLAQILAGLVTIGVVARRRLLFR